MVSSAYLKILFDSDKVCKSLFIITYNVGPMPEPCTMLKPICLTLDKAPLSLHCWIMDWSGYLFNVINVIKVFRLTYVHRVV